ncbi:hypothetical protein V8E54_015072 [Elaphomyces granulatus]
MESIVSSKYLPHDGDQVFEAIAADITKPDRKDLANFACWHDKSYAKSYFVGLFNSLGEIMRQEEDSESQELSDSESQELSRRNYSFLSKDIMMSLINTILRFVHTSTKIAIFPLTTFTVMKYHEKDTGIIYHEVPQVLIQAFLAFQKNPALDIHRAFALRMEGTKLQLSAASISRTYIDTLSQGKHLSDGFTLLSSKAYDLREPEERREAVRLLIGLLRYLGATQSNS